MSVHPDDYFGPAWELGHACQRCYEAAVKLKPRILAGDDIAAFEYGILAGNAMKRTGGDYGICLQISKLIFDQVLKA